MSPRCSRLVTSVFVGAFSGLASLSAQQSVTISPASLTLTIGQAHQFTAAGTVVPSEVGAGGEYTCVRMSDGTEYCTGRNQFGQLGNGSSANAAVPSPVPLSSIARLVPGDEFNCALLADGTMQCWGDNDYGQLGNGTSGPGTWTVSPGPVSGITTAVAAGAGYNHACALL